MSGYWAGRRVCVTGGAGFLGAYVVQGLRNQGCAQIFVPRSSDYDLRGRRAIVRMFDDAKPDIVIHLAAVVGGIGANQRNPAGYLYDNLIMGLQLIDEANQRRLDKCVLLGTVCAYPKFCPVPFREDDLWNGFPEETNAPYGVAKKVLLLQAQAYRQQHRFNGIYLLPANLYGPGDNFELESSHVIPALIRKCVAAKHQRSKLTVWGTGLVSREFLYVEDCAEGILLAAEHYSKPEPVNLGTGRETQIRELVSLIAEITGFEGEVVWDPGRPDGQPRRSLDTSRASEEFGFRARTSLEDGVRRTVAWYLEHLGVATRSNSSRHG